MNNLTAPHIYYYNETDHKLPFPGGKMSSNGGNNWYTYTIYGVDNPKVIFNDSKNKQVPGNFQSGYLVTQDVWYKDNTWTTYKPD